ncbi:uncharacterized protein G2W53_015453 [Senna tora]|uniref:Uncharacterized protein n=1 Tax=Senna tora TaxID=362788 RepID=A0A834WUU0_9FABA|nr:uncharacterized protein G2W53_015453 [Senna tora]
MRFEERSFDLSPQLLETFVGRDECSAMLLWWSPKKAVQAVDSVNIPHKSRHRSLFSIFGVWFDLPYMVANTYILFYGIHTSLFSFLNLLRPLLCASSENIVF